MKTVNQLIEQLKEISKNGYGGSLVYSESNHKRALSGFNYKEIEYKNGHIDTVIVLHLDEI